MGATVLVYLTVFFVISVQVFIAVSQYKLLKNNSKN